MVAWHSNFKWALIGIAFGVLLICIAHDSQLIENPPPVDMPVVQESDPYLASIKDYDPLPQRDGSVTKWLKNSFRISVKGSSGSGTMTYYDANNNLAYVTSCGHLWSGNMPASENYMYRPKATITVWYQNNNKLVQPKNYEAEVIFYSNDRGYDCSLLTFSPDWTPDSYFPIAPQSYNLQPGIKLHSCGCDGGTEVAHYEVEFVQMNGSDVVTRYNSPRPGRSGGGLMDHNGNFVGICWGTSDTSGNGIGYFTSVNAIRELYQKNGFGWLLDQTHMNAARQIPIIDRNSPQGSYPNDYVPIPVFDGLRF